MFATTLIKKAKRLSFSQQPLGFDVTNIEDPFAMAELCDNDITISRGTRSMNDLKSVNLFTVRKLLNKSKINQ